MIETQRYLVKSIGKCISFRFYRNISNMSVKNDKTKSTENTKDAEKSKKEGNTPGKKRRFINYDEFLPDTKGNITVCLIGGSMSAVYTAVLLKQSRLIKRIHLVDTKDSFCSAVADANHIDTTPRIKYFKRKSVKQAIKEINIIALMDETNVPTESCPTAQFEAISSYICEMGAQMAGLSAESLVAVFTRPVTATLPMVSEIYKLSGWWDPDRIIGSTALDRMRMETITANLLDLNPAFLSIPMVGGADSRTIIPLLSCASPINCFTNAQQSMLLQSLRSADKEMASIQCEGPTLSDGAAATKLILALARGLSGFKNVTSSAYVRSNALPVCRYFTSELLFGPGGVQKNFGLPKMSPLEIMLVEQAVPCINEHIAMATRALYKNSNIKLKTR